MNPCGDPDRWRGVGHATESARERAFGRRPRTGSGRRGGGFTLIEMVITLAIMAVLATMLLPVGQFLKQREQERELRRSLVEIRRGIDDYKRAVDAGSIKRPTGSSGYPPTLDLLVTGVVDERDPKGRQLYFMRRIPDDPLNAAQAGMGAGSWGKRSYASGPLDPQEGDDVYDVHSRSEGVGLNGVPYSKW